MSDRQPCDSEERGERVPMEELDEAFVLVEEHVSVEDAWKAMEVLEKGLEELERLRTGAGEETHRFQSLEEVREAYLHDPVLYNFVHHMIDSLLRDHPDPSTEGEVCPRCRGPLDAPPTAGGDGYKDCQHCGWLLSEEYSEEDDPEVDQVDGVEWVRADAAPTGSEGEDPGEHLLTAKHHLDVAMGMLLTRHYEIRSRTSEGGRGRVEEEIEAVMAWVYDTSILEMGSAVWRREKRETTDRILAALDGRE